MQEQPAPDRAHAPVAQHAHTLTFSCSWRPLAARGAARRARGWRLQLTAAGNVARTHKHTHTRSAPEGRASKDRARGARAAQLGGPRCWFDAAHASRTGRQRPSTLKGRVRPTTWPCDGSHAWHQQGACACQCRRSLAARSAARRRCAGRKVPAGCERLPCQHATTSGRVLGQGAAVRLLRAARGN